MSSLCGKTNLNSAPAFAAHVRAACAGKASRVELRLKPVTAPARARGQCAHTKRRLTDCVALNYQGQRAACIARLAVRRGARAGCVPCQPLAGKQSLNTLDAASFAIGSSSARRGFSECDIAHKGKGVYDELG